MSDHGRIIPLTAEPYEQERHIEIYAEYAADSDKPSLQLEVVRRLDWIQQRTHGGKVEIRHRARTILAGIDAERVLVRYYDEKSNLWRIEDFIEAPRDGVQYSLYLRTSEQSYPQDRPILDGVVRSFVLTRN